jgi:hypothetical protein
MQRLTVIYCFALAVSASALAPATPRSNESAAERSSDDTITEYQRKLQQYLEAYEKYELEARRYWNLIAEKRQFRRSKWRSREAISLDDYVLTQPPRYSGPAKPPDPFGRDNQPPSIEKYVPVKADFLRNAADFFKFAPSRPETEIQFKRAYSRRAFEAGLTKDQVVRIYAFEVGGDGKYDTQAGLEIPKAGAKAISTALGYNQLLVTNSIELLAEKGDRFVKTLKQEGGAGTTSANEPLLTKIRVLQQMIEFCRTVPDWRKHDQLADTPKGVGVHAILLDIHIGPLLQVQKLLDSVLFARKNGVTRELTAAELEMMNLTGDSNGLDIVLMPNDVREQVPTANFFQAASYDRNPEIPV